MPVGHLPLHLRKRREREILPTAFAHCPAIPRVTHYARIKAHTILSQHPNSATPKIYIRLFLMEQIVFGKVTKT